MSRSLGAIRKNGSNSYRALSKKQTFRSLTPYGPPTILFGMTRTSVTHNPRTSVTVSIDVKVL